MSALIVAKLVARYESTSNIMSNAQNNGHSKIRILTIHPTIVRSQWPPLLDKNHYPAPKAKHQNNESKQPQTTVKDYKQFEFEPATFG